MGERDALRSPKSRDSLPPSTEKTLQRERTRQSDELEAGQIESITSRYPWKAIHAWSEGAYGPYKNFGTEYQTLVLFMGGSGVAHGLPIMLDIVRRARAMQKGLSECAAVVTRRIVFVWVVRDPSHLAWIEDELAEAIEYAPPGLLHLRIHCSKADKIPIDGRYQPEEHDGTFGPARFLLGDDASRGTEPKPYRPILFRAGRPRVDEIIESEVQATAPEDWVAVGVCGPSSLQQAVSEATSKAIRPSLVLRGEHRRNIKLSAEEFGW